MSSLARFLSYIMRAVNTHSTLSQHSQQAVNTVNTQLLTQSTLPDVIWGRGHRLVGSLKIPVSFAKELCKREVYSAKETYVLYME